MDITYWVETQTGAWSVCTFKDVLQENVNIQSAMVSGAWGVEFDVKLTPEDNKKECWKIVAKFNYEIQNAKSILVECDILKEEHSCFERIFPSELQAINKASFKALKSSDGSREIKKQKIKMLKAQMAAA
jgi:hypothetical protein